MNQEKWESQNQVNQNQINQQQMYINQNIAPGMQVQGISAFENEKNERKAKQVIVGFVISIIGLILLFFGVTYGWILLGLEFYLGVNGLQTRQRGLAIATIVIASISIAIFVLALIVGFATI